MLALSLEHDFQHGHPDRQHNARSNEAYDDPLSLSEVAPVVRTDFPLR
jgi:hypothetical protein